LSAEKDEGRGKREEGRGEEKEYCCCCYVLCSVCEELVLLE